MLIFAACSVSSLHTEGPYFTAKPFYSHEETINIKCDKNQGFEFYYYSDQITRYNRFNHYYRHNRVSTNDLQINATCFYGNIYLNESIRFFGIYCEPSNYFYSYIQVLTISANNFYHINILIIKYLF